MDSLRARAESAKANIQSSTTCTAATVQILTELLLPKTGCQEDPPAPSAGAVARRNTASKTRPARTATVGTKGAKNPSQRNGEPAQLSLKERSILASEVINTTLKTLKPSAKAPEEAPAAKSRPALSRRYTKQPITRSNTDVTRSPLIPKCLNRVSSSPVVPRSQHTRASSSASSSPVGPFALAECARIGFACMRGLQASSPPVVDLPPLQLESGMSALVGKLIILELDDLALKELRILKRRLEGGLAVEPQATSRSRSNTAVAGTKPAADRTTMADLLDYGDKQYEGARLGLVITAQIHAMKLIASFKKKSNVEATVPKLLPSHKSSPVNLVKQFAGAKSQAAKAVRHLETLSQLVLSLCPRSSSSQDDIATTPKLTASPEAVIRLQTIAYQYRFSQWALSGHKGNSASEIWEPFSKCLAAYARRSRIDAQLRYMLASELVETLSGEGRTYGDLVSDSHTPPFISIYHILGSLAQDAGIYKEAISWLEKVQTSISDADSSDIQCCVVRARLVSLKLKLPEKSPDVEDLLLSVTQDMVGNLKGESSALDELLIALSMARRAAVNVLSTQSSPDSRGTPKDGLRELCEALVFACPKFIVRYIGKKPDRESTTKYFVQYEQRRHNAIKCGANTVESALYLTKVFINEGRASWDKLDSTLQDCLLLLESIQADNNSATNSTTTSQFVKASHIYWIQHLNAKRCAKDQKDLTSLRALRRSIDCVKSRPNHEKKAAALASKLERLAEICSTLGRIDEADEALVCLRDELIADGALSAVTDAASSKSATEAWDVDGDTAILARTLKSLIKLHLRRDGGNPDLVLLSNEHWSNEEHGALLEYCLSILLSQRGASIGSSRSASLDKSISFMVQGLRKNYTIENFPVRRFRSMLHLQCYAPELYASFTDDSDDTEFWTNITKAQILDTKDAGLSSYLDHMQAFASSMAELEKEQPDVNALRTAIAVWLRICEECENGQHPKSRVDNIPDLLCHLRGIADFCHVKGHMKLRIIVLKLVARLNEASEYSSSVDETVISYSNLASQYLELGYSGKAGLAFDKAQSYAQQANVGVFARLRLQLSYSEYLLVIGDLENCEQTLLQAHALAMSEGQEAWLSYQSSSKLLARNLWSRLVADAYLCSSLLAFQRGSIEIAVQNARRSVRLTARTWTCIEQLGAESAKAKDIHVDKLSEDISNLSIADAEAAASRQRSSPTTALLWPLVNPMFKSLTHLSTLYSHLGMFQETVYYAEQARKIVFSVNSDLFAANTLALLGSVHLRGDEMEQGSELIVQARNIHVSSGEHSRYSVLATCQLARCHRMLEDYDAEMAAYKSAEAALATIMDTTHITGLDKLEDEASMLQEKMAKMALEDKPKPTRKAVGRPRAKPVAKKAPVKATVKKTAAAKSKPIPEKPSIDLECLELASLKAQIFHSRASAMMLVNDLTDLTNILSQADVLSKLRGDHVSQLVTMAQHLLLASLEKMTSDPVLSVLQDSTLSLPSVKWPRADKSTGTHLSPRRGSTLQVPAASPANRRRSNTRLSSSVCDMLYDAYDHLSQAYVVASEISASSVVRQLSGLLSNITILVATTSATQGQRVARPGLATCSIDIARNIAVRRERLTIRANASSSKSDTLEWPTEPLSSPNSVPKTLISDLSDFQKSYVDIIPPSWTAISIALSASKSELYITKLVATQSPFVLRLPLGRDTSRDMDEELFDFDTGLSELAEIISLANSSAQGARSMSKEKGAKSAWWSERINLDERLKFLLENIEKVWLGGFKGIFSQHVRRPQLLARFQTSFTNILNKHLPSRQSGGGGKKRGTSKKQEQSQTPINLDPRVLELFVGLGDATNECEDFDEPLTDLLYFVIDILQFHGERNAYDEIDFDSMTVETLDALRHYHAAQKSLAVHDRCGDVKYKHTVLVLDKELKAFPWESLPCMQGIAVSRLPSLEDLRVRILAMERMWKGESMVDENEDELTCSVSPEEKQRQNGRLPGHYISRPSTSYVLNPSGDLTSTQQTFLPLLSPHFSGLVGTPPSEDHLAHTLQTNDLFLYFGHGSGAQYIRSSSIRKLEKCATAVLMGCSSVAVECKGEFEGIGAVRAWIGAGAPAVVGTLWDVTDRDCDRFAVGMFGAWGLNGGGDGDESVMETKVEKVEKGRTPKNPGKSKGKGKKKAAEVEVKEVKVQQRNKVSLVEAVARGRQACNLRYLTAAAVVVYGIPVYFD